MAAVWTLPPMEESHVITPEVAPETPYWRRSSYCGDSACVEVAMTPDANGVAHAIGVRDAKRVDSPVLRFTRDEWCAFIAGVKKGEFDFA